jgi:hypothetical protein
MPLQQRRAADRRRASSERQCRADDAPVHQTAMKPDAVRRCGARSLPDRRRAPRRHGASKADDAAVSYQRLTLPRRAPAAAPPLRQMV